MKCVVVAAISKDGFIASEDGDKDWMSQEDADFLKDMIVQSDLVVMGSHTFLDVRPKPLEGVLKVVLTSHPEKYQEYRVDGQIEFVNLSAKNFYLEYSKNYNRLLVLGGKQVYSDFWSSGLVDEVWLTIEPINLSRGVRFMHDKHLSQLTSMTPSSTQQLNSKGTTLLHYSLKK